MRPIVQTPLEKIRQKEQEDQRLRESVITMEESNAMLSYELMMANAANEELQAQHSNLVYDLMQKGVL